MKKKPSKIAEAATPYAAKKAASGAVVSAMGAPDKQVRYIDAGTARKLTGEILDKHHELFRKLAQ